MRGYMFPISVVQRLYIFAPLVACFQHVYLHVPWGDLSCGGYCDSGLITTLVCSHTGLWSCFHSIKSVCGCPATQGPVFQSGAVCSLRMIRQRQGRWAEVRMREGKTQIGKWKTPSHGCRINAWTNKRRLSQLPASSSPYSASCSRWPAFFPHVVNLDFTRTVLPN